LTQNNELQKIKLRIHALTQKTQTAGCTEAEAVTAMEAVGRLLKQYNLSMEDIDIREEPCVTGSVTFGGKKINRAMGTVLSALGRFTDCRVWTDRHNGDTIQYKMFGMESDVEMNKYLLQMIYKAMVNGTNNYKSAMGSQTYRGQKKVAQTSFQNGFASRIAHRLQVIKDQRDAELAAARGTGSALMVLKGELVRQEFDISGPGNLRKSKYYHRTQYDHSANTAGQSAGERVNLSRPIGTSVGANKLIA
jgi:hypothetical protein